MTHYLITGGAGFIGSNLVERLLNDQHNVTVIDNLSTGSQDNLFQGANFIEGDVSDLSILEKLNDSHIDGVVHLAAQSSGAIGQKDPMGDMQSNVASSVALIHWCKQKNIKRFIYASSMTVYGNGNESAVSENHPLMPTGYYGVGKMASENYLRVAASEGLVPTIFRFYSVYGPRQNMNNLKQGILSIYLSYLAKKERLPVTGSFDRYRDLIFIDDVVDVLTQSLYKTSMPAMVYNLGSGKSTTVRSLISTLIEKLSLPSDHPVDQLAGDPHDIFGCIANVDLLKRDLSWESKVALDQGIDKMLVWAKEKFGNDFSKL